MDMIYLNRISTANKDQDPTSNLDVCKGWCKYSHHKIKYMLIDKGVSGSIPYYERKEASKIDQIIDEYKEKGKELGIIVFSIDRFSRQHPVRALSILEDLKDKGIQVFSATESIFNEDSEFALPMQFNILWFNFYFLIQHSKKVKAGIEKRRKAGLFVGRGLLKKTIGKGKNKKYIYYDDNELEEIHRIIKAEKKRKFSYREIKARLEQHNIKISISYISKVINNEK